MENCLWNFYLPCLFRKHIGINDSCWIFKRARKYVCLMSDVSMGMTPLQSEFRVQPVDVDSSFQNFSGIVVVPQNFLQSIYELWYMKLRNNQNWFDGQTFLGSLWFLGEKKTTTTQATQISRQANHWNSTLMSIPSLFFYGLSGQVKKMWNANMCQGLLVLNLKNLSKTQSLHTSQVPFSHYKMTTQITSCAGGNCIGILWNTCDSSVHTDHDSEIL